MRGYFGIGIYEPCKRENIGTLFRSASNFNADFIFVVGRKYKVEKSDTTKTHRHIPMFEYNKWEDFIIPKDCKLIGVEIDNRSKNLAKFVHPERSIYILGSEKFGLPENVMKKCDALVYIDTNRCMNVASVAGIVMYDRTTKYGTKQYY